MTELRELAVHVWLFAHAACVCSALACAAIAFQRSKASKGDPKALLAIGAIFALVALYHGSAGTRLLLLYLPTLRNLPKGALLWGVTENGAMAAGLVLFALFLSGMLFPPPKS